MSEPFLGEIRQVSFGFPPKGWALCNGQLLPINQNQALFSLFGTTYGGDGRVNFALPNLQGRTPVSFGQGITQGQILGQETHTLIQSEVPLHNHFMQAASVAATAPKPGGNLLANTSGALTIYSPAANLAAMNPATISISTGSQPHENRQPYLVM